AGIYAIRTEEMVILERDQAVLQGGGVVIGDVQGEVSDDRYLGLRPPPGTDSDDPLVTEHVERSRGRPQASGDSGTGRPGSRLEGASAGGCCPWVRSPGRCPSSTGPRSRFRGARGCLSGG